MKTVKDIMSKDCITVTKEANMQEVAQLMKQHNIGFIPVVESSRKLVGVVTDRDMVIRGYADNLSGTSKINEVISNGIRTVQTDATVDEVAQIMADEQIRRLPVVENGNLLGVVAIGDLAVRGIYSNEAGEALSEISEKQHGLPLQ